MKKIRLQVCSIIIRLKFLSFIFSTGIFVISWWYRTQLVSLYIPWGLMQCQPHMWLLISSYWLNEWHNHLPFFPHVFCSGHRDYPLSLHMAPRPPCMPLQWMTFSSDHPSLPRSQLPTHLLTSSSNVRSSTKHLLKSRWCLIHLYVPSIWLRVKVMKCVLKWESERTEGQSQYHSR